MPRLGETAKGAAPLLEAAQEARRRVPCRGCGAPMIFIPKPKGDGLMPVDAQETTIAVVGEDGTTRLVKGHVPHHITCPQADQFRNRGK
jgi:hypothetical protein